MLVVISFQLLLFTLLVVFLMGSLSAGVAERRGTTHNNVRASAASQSPSGRESALSRYPLGKAATPKVPPFPAYLKGKTASLSWINGSDCQAGIQAYLRSARGDPSAALVGTGWLNPLNGNLISDWNNCSRGSHSMDNVVQLVHQYGGLAYLTITMDTQGAYAWSFQQGATYVDEATKNPKYINSIVHEVQRAHYDGVIMDLEGVDHMYPSIQQIFATFNQKVWAALRPLHKWYGIALIHKVSEHDEYYELNGFENWNLLAHCADFIVIMSLDQSYDTPGPSVSFEWLKQLLSYTLKTMPAMLTRIIWELPLYGNSWHQEQKKWVFDGIITYQAARAMIQQAAPSRIDIHASDLNDFYAPHLVYSDASGMKHAVWYMTPRSLYSIIVLFKQAMREEPGFTGYLQLAFWLRTTQEPSGFWQLLDTLYWPPNATR